MNVSDHLNLVQIALWVFCGLLLLEAMSRRWVIPTRNEAVLNTRNRRPLSVLSSSLVKVPDRSIQIAVWIYFWLLLLEGIFRKWLLPQWSDAIFIIRDPLVLVIYVLALRARVFPARPAMVMVWIFALLSLAFSVAGETTFLVTLFGLRTNYLHLPLIFVMARVFDRDDVLTFGRWFLITSLPVIMLMVMQFNSPPDAWVNVGVGASEIGQLRGAMGHIRPPGPFSFISGVVSFFAFVCAFVLYGWMHRGTWSTPLLLVASFVVVLAIPVSISRSLTFALLVVAFFAGIVVLSDIRRLPTYVGPLAAVLSFGVLGLDSVYVRAFVTRWQEASEAGGGDFYVSAVLRLFDGFLVPFQVAADAPLMGHGIGLGTVAGARLMTGEYTFLLAESELARIVLELGPILGFAFIAWRIWLSGLMVWKGWSRYRTDGDALSWLIAGASFLGVFWGQWGPSTTLGYAVFGAGLTLAAANFSEEKPAETDNEEEIDPEGESSAVE